MKILFNNDLYEYKEKNKDEIISVLSEYGLPPLPNEIEDTAGEWLHNEYLQLVNAFKEYDYKNKYDYILVCGCLGLWNGKRKVKATFKTLSDAINKALQYDNQLIYFDKSNSTLTANDYHHDGTNIFKFYKVVNGKKYAIKYNDLLSCY